MKLKSLIQGLPVLEMVVSPSAENFDPEITGICQDSRYFHPGQIFVAIRGLQFDGHQFVPEASAKGAAALVVENKTIVPESFKGTVLLVKDSRLALDKLAAQFYGHPSAGLFMAGVTGTNGKTTTTYLLEAILNAGLGPTGVMGTINNHLGSRIIPATHTTPDALSLQALLAEWKGAGAKAVAMEVSSHALSLRRVDSVAFDAAIFTNLTRDHLDFHKTMEGYRDAKARLFGDLLGASGKKSKRAIINGEDPAAPFMIAKAKEHGVPHWTFGVDRGDIATRKIQLSFDGSSFEVHGPHGIFGVNLKMIGRHNVANSLGAIGTALHAGVSPEVIARSLGALSGVPGRLQRVTGKASVRVFVDYAHSDDALTNALGFLSQLRNETSPKSQIITVFGCGGDRDRGKRPLMFKAAAKYSSTIVVTSDNPRTEDPGQIIKDILSETGGNPPGNTLVDVDRRKAIELALKKAGPGDVVLIAGKGHEDYQIVGTEKKQFDDVKIAKEILDS